MIDDEEEERNPQRTIMRDNNKGDLEKIRIILMKSDLKNNRTI